MGQTGMVMERLEVTCQHHVHILEKNQLGNGRSYKMEIQMSEQGFLFLCLNVIFEPDLHADF